MRINISLDEETKEKAQVVAKAWGFLGLSQLIRHMILSAWAGLGKDNQG
jgi:hypothetical protein